MRMMSSGRMNSRHEGCGLSSHAACQSPAVFFRCCHQLAGTLTDARCFSVTVRPASTLVVKCTSIASNWPGISSARVIDRL